MVRSKQGQENNKRVSSQGQSKGNERLRQCQGNASTTSTATTIRWVLTQLKLT